MENVSSTSRSHPVTSLSLFFPCFNEKDAIGALAKKTLTVARQICDDFEIIFVDDGSTDGTSELIDQLASKDPVFRAVHHTENRGYGAALQSGFRAATKEYVFYTDGDGQFDINEILSLLPLIDKYDIVSGYRLKRQEGLLRKFNAFCWSSLVGFLFSLKLKDVDCAFKLYKRGIFDHIEMHSTGALIDTEILARAKQKGYSITQIGVHHYPRVAGRATGASLKVIVRAFRELFQLRKKILRK